MLLKSISLQNFRNYTKSEFNFSPNTTIVVGPNAIGKTNLIDAIYILATGKSSRADNYDQLIKFGESISRIRAEVDDQDLEVVLSNSQKFIQKKFLINGVLKTRAGFAGRIAVVQFSPLDLNIVDGQPGIRRRFLDEVLEQIDQEYGLSQTAYVKALRQRNALLQIVQETGSRDEKQFLYWDELLIKNGQNMTKKRNELIEYINKRKKEIFEFDLEYDSSIISVERLLQYKNAEVGAGVTLVGPHRDEVLIQTKNRGLNNKKIRDFGSRGQQRLVALELKLAQIALIKEGLDIKPLLLLDDVFSELDENNIDHVLQLMDQYQTIATTTHKEFIKKRELNNLEMIELGDK